MDSLLPIFFCCFGPILWGGLFFALGRYSKTHRLILPRISRVEPNHSPFYENFQEE